MVLVRCILRIFLLSCCIPAISSKCNKKLPGRNNYAMYVWTEGFDNTVAGCGEAEFMAWNSGGPCFTHTWNDEQKRSWLWNTANLHGREVGSIFVSDVYQNLKYAYDNQDCNTADVALVKQMLVEGHTQVRNLKIYGLYAVDDLDVTEKDLVKYIVHYNDVCASNANERFDGVATNNEAYKNLKCGDMTSRQTYLDNLQKIVTEAKKQIHGTLLTHYSMGWHWALCSGVTVNTIWNGVDQDVHRHMIDIFDSVDVQVGYIIHPAVSDRTKIAGYDYALSLNKTMYTTVYLNKESPCQITMFPDDTCTIKGHNETAMFQLFDEFSANGIPEARPSIHYFRGVYSTGVVPAWPKHG